MNEHSRFHRILTPAKRPEKTRPPHIARSRDEIVTSELGNALVERGIAMPGEVLFNNPDPEPANRLLPYEECLDVDLGFARPHDWLGFGIRPPMHDLEHGDRLQVEPANTRLERQIFWAFEQYLERCARSFLRLTPPLRRCLPPHLADRAEMTFFQEKNSACYKTLGMGRLRREVEGLKRTPAFLLRQEELFPGGPGLIAAFAMNGIASIAWAYRLRRDLAHLLDGPGFWMYELEPRPVPRRATDLRWAAEWKVERVLACPAVAHAA